jgi:hypothetical protein
MTVGLHGRTALAGGGLTGAGVAYTTVVVLVLVGAGAA